MSWLTLVGSVSLHAAVFALAAHFVIGSGDERGLPAADAPDGSDAADVVALSLSVKVAAPVLPTSAAAKSSMISKALPAQQQRVFAAAHTDFALPPPEPQLDLPEPRTPEKQTERSIVPSLPDAPPTKKFASQTKKRGSGSKSNSASGNGVGRSSGNATAPKPIATRVPVYPYSAKKRGEQGMVLVRVRVNESGRVASSALYRSCGHAELDEAAVACVWKWSFAPGLAEGKAVESSAVVRVSFRLEG